MSADDKYKALFEQAVEGVERIERENSEGDPVPIEVESEAGETVDGGDEALFAPDDVDAAAPEVEAAVEAPTAAATKPATKPKSANDVVMEAVLKAKQEALDALAQTQKEAKDMYDQLLRKTADFDNFRKRSRKQQDDAVRFANEDLLREFLPVMDNFERALAHVGDKADDPVVQGLSMVKQQLDATMAKLGVMPLSTVGQAFDPKFHEAVEREETDSVDAGAVVREYQKGYTLKDNLLRPAMVVVAVPKPVAQAAEKAAEKAAEAQAPQPAPTAEAPSPERAASDSAEPGDVDDVN